MVERTGTMEKTISTLNNAVDTQGPKLVLKRKVYTQQAHDEQYIATEKPRTSLSQRISSTLSCSKSKCYRIFEAHFPVIRFVRHYQVKTALLGDFLAGLCVSFMHLPQAMGYGVLATLRPVHGLYSTFFPVLIYVIFGTSAFQSFGTNAVLVLLTQTVVEREAQSFVNSYAANLSSNHGNLSEVNHGPTEEEILNVKISTAMACSFLTGAFLVGMGVLRLGFLTTYLSVSFVGGFTTASAVHIASSQVPKMFGIKVNSVSGPGKLIRMYVDLFTNIQKTQWVEVIITVICMAILFIVKICVNERFKDKMKMPVPIDLIVVIIGTAISYLTKLEDTYSVKVVGPIPSGIPAPAMPRFQNSNTFIVDCFVMAILSFAMSISMAKLTARMHGINIDDNQELIAYGSCNLLSGFFYSFPSATGPPRTMLLSSLGAKTTLNGIPTAVFILCVLLWIGQLFAPLPLSVLAAMIIVSMKDVLMQLSHLPHIWSVNRYDFITWVITCLVSVFVDLDYGLVAGVCVSLLMVVVQTQMVSAAVLGVSGKEDIILEVNKHKMVTQYEGVKLFRFPTSLYFATAENFKRQLYSKVEDPFQVRKEPEKEMEAQIVSGTSENNLEFVYSNRHFELEVEKDDDVVHEVRETEGDIYHIIIDCRSIPYIDMSGYNMIQQVVKEYNVIGVAVSLVGCQAQVLKVLETSGFFKDFPKERCFVDVFDALQSLNFRKKSIKSEMTRF